MTAFCLSGRTPDPQATAATPCESSACRRASIGCIAARFESAGNHSFRFEPHPRKRPGFPFKAKSVHSVRPQKDDIRQAEAFVFQQMNVGAVGQFLKFLDELLKLFGRRIRGYQASIQPVGQEMSSKATSSRSGGADVACKNDDVRLNCRWRKGLKFQMQIAKDRGGRMRRVSVRSPRLRARPVGPSCSRQMGHGQKSLDYLSIRGRVQGRFGGPE